MVQIHLFSGVVWTVKKGDVATLRNWTPPPPAAPKGSV